MIQETLRFIREEIVNQYRQLQTTHTYMYTYINIFSVFYIQILLQLYKKKFKRELSPKFNILNIILENQQAISLLLAIIRREEQDLKIFCNACIFYYAVASNICVYEIAKLSRSQSINPNQEIATEQYVKQVKRKCFKSKSMVVFEIIIVFMVITYYYCSPENEFGCPRQKLAGFTIGMLSFMVLTFLNLIQLIRGFDRKYSLFPFIYIVIKIIEIYFCSTTNWIYVFVIESLTYSIIYTFIMFRSFSQKKEIENNHTEQFELVESKRSSSIQL